MKQKNMVSAEGQLHTGGRMAGDERRQQIIRLAIELFSKKGFRGTTTKEIAQAAGVSEAIIFRHFETKEELYSAIIDDCACVNSANPLEKLIESFQTKDDRTVFATLALEILNFHDENPAFQRLLLHSALEGHKLSQMFWDTMILHVYDVLGGYISQRQAEGAFRVMNPKIAVRAFIGMVIHHSINNHLWDKEGLLINASNEEAAREFTDILLRGITAERGQQGEFEVAPERRANDSSKE